MRVYFAHPMSDYDSPFEHDCLLAVQTHFLGIGRRIVEVVNPNSPEVKLAWDRRVAQVGYEHAFPFWPDLASDCDVCVGLRMPHGRWSAGVAAEMRAALAAARPVFEVMHLPHRGWFSFIRVFRLHDAEVLTRDETRAAIKRYVEFQGRGRG